jgi:hypothetical protein
MTNLFFKTEQDGSVVVYEVIEGRKQARTKVFQGTMQEAEAYIERRRGRSASRRAERNAQG